MRSRFLLFYAAFERLLTGIALAAGVALFFVMWLVVANALSRKLFNQPITGTLELTEALMPVVIMLPMAFTQMHRGHVRVLMLIDGLPPTVRRALHVMALIISCALFAWVSWATWGYAMRSLRVGETAWGIVRFPIWPTKVAISLGAALLTIQFLLDIVKVAFISDDPPEDFSATPEEEATLHG